jgi:hypothetical protein
MIPQPAEFAARHGGEDDRPAIEHEVDRDDHWHAVDHISDPAEVDGSAQQSQALLCRQLLELVPPVIAHCGRLPRVALRGGR